MEDTLNNKLGNKIKSIRNKHKLSQQRFGKKIGVSGKSISAYEKGTIKPSQKVMDKISIIYGENINQKIDKYKVTSTINRLKDEILHLEMYINSLNTFSDNS